MNTKNTIKKIAAVTLAALAFGFAPSAWAVSVEYRYATYNTEGDPKSGIKEWKTGVQESPTEVASYTGTRTWNSGWYVVTGTKTISGRITCKGNVHLILTDGATLNASAGITVNTVNSATLTIYGQSEGTGTLVATTTTTGNAGIGGYKNSSASYRDSGAITIHGGNVTASGGDQASGIGGGSYNGTGGTGKDITINGGTVVVKGGGGAAGIGGGYGGDSSNCGIGENIVINGGNVTSSCDGNNGSGIGGGKFGYGKNIWFNGGTVTVTGGAVTDSGATSGVGNGYGNATQSSEIYAGSRVTVSVSGDGNNWTEVAHETGVDLAGNIKYRYFKTTPLTPKVIAIGSCEHGTVLASASEALPGETVTLTATPETGYVLYDIRAYKTGQEAIEVPLTPVVEDKTYSFTMPGYAVTVAATFVTAFTELIPSAPTSVDNATYKVYTKGVESADGKVWSNRKAVVVYTAADGCYFEDGSTVSTNELDTTANPAVNKTTPATPRSAMPITVNPGIENGTVTASKAAAAKGEKITLTIASESGYAYGTDDVKVYRTGDEATTVEVKDDAFVMPTFPVTVSVAFKKGFAYRHAVYNTAGDAKGGIKEWKTATADATPIDAQTTWGSSGKETWYVVNADKTISSRIKCIGNVHLVLADGATLTASAGISVNAANSATLTIYGQSAGTGTLVAKGSSTGYAGIGGDYSNTKSTERNSGAVTIHGGTVTATGGSNAAGIGGGYKSSGGTGKNIAINGGVVTATGGAGGAGIGGAYQTQGGDIVINGGTITASSSGSNPGSGIGDGGTYLTGWGISTTYGPNIYVAENLLVRTRASAEDDWSTIAHTATTDLSGEETFRRTHVNIFLAYEVRAAACENGTVTASPVWAGENNLVTLTASPGDNCLLKSIAAYKLDDPEIPVELTPDANDLKYTFTMPAYDVAVEATFVPPQSLASVDLACLDVAVTLNDFPGDVAWTASSSNPNVATITSAGEAGTKPVVTSVALGEATMIIVTADRVYCCKTTVSHDFKPSESGMSFAVFTYDGVTLPIFYRGAAASLEASADPKAASGELVLVFTDPNAAAVFEIPEPYLARAQVQTVGGGDVEGMTYETNVRLDKGRYAVNVGSGADAKVVVRIMKVFENVQIPYPDIAEEERRAKDGSLGLYTDGYGATPIIKVDPASPEMALTAYNSNAVRRASNGQDYTYAEVVSHTDGTVTTTDGVGTYQFVLNLKEGYSWQDGSALGSMDGRIVTWRIAEDPDCVAAELAINKSVRWSDDDPNAVITISSHASPAQSASVPNVLFIGTMCNGHSLDADRIIRSINSVAKNANVDWYLFNKPANDGSSGANYYQNDLSGHVERNHTVGYMVKYGESLSITWDYQGNVIQSNPTLSSGTYSWSALKMNTNNHQALVPFLKKLDELLVEGNKYDYIVLEFDGSRLCDDYCSLKYDGTTITDTKGKVAYARYENERRVAERLLPYYQSGKVLWVTDNSHNDSVEVWPYKSPNKYRPNTYFNNSQNRCLTLQQYEGLVALLDPERYLQYKDGKVDTIYQESKTAYQKTHYANRAWEMQMNYEDAENLYTFLEDAVKVQPYNLSLIDTVRRHSGLSLTSVNCYVATNDLPVAATEGWVKMAEWVPSMGTTFDVSTWETQAIKGFGWVDETKSAIDADENTVRFLATNITEDVWLKVEIGIVDDGAFRSNVEAVFNPVTGQYEKNPNDGKARMAMLDQDGKETVTGEAATAVPWKYSCHDIRVRAAFGEIAVNGLTNGLALAADNSITGTISICERSNPVVSFQALEDCRMTSLLIDGEERFDGVTAPTSWTFEQLLCDHEVSVAYEVIMHDISLVQPVNGTVAIEGTGVIRKPVTLTVTPDAGYALDTITVTAANGDVIALDENNTFIMPDDDVTIAATFVKKTCAITCAAVADGAISVPETADAGSTVTLKFNTLDFVLTEGTLKAKTGEVDVALKQVDADTYAFTMPDGAVRVDATYTAIVTQPVLHTAGGETKQLTIPAEWRAAYKLRNSQVTNVTQKLDNGMTAWQSFVLGADPTNALSGIYADVEQDDKADSVTIETKGLGNIKVGEGFDLAYRLEKVENTDFVKNGDSPNFDLPITGDDPTGHYKLSMFVTDGNGVPVEGAIEAINTVGIVKQTQAATNAIISVPWSRLAPGQDQEIQVSEVVKTANLDEGDELRVYRPGSSTYESYTLDANKQWVAAKTFKVAAVGSGSQSDAPEAPAATITRGSGIWLCRKDPSKPYFLYGQSNGADESKVTVVQGPNLIGATGTGDYDLNEHILNAQAGDVIMVPQATSDAPKRFEYKDGAWGYMKGTVVERVVAGRTFRGIKNTWTTNESFVPAGTGFWLHNNSGKITVK